jgi:hypothetical protein
MAGWQEELAELLRELGVTQEEPQTNLRFTGKSARSENKWRLQPGKAFRHLAGPFFSDVSESDDPELMLTDLTVMRHKVDAIVRQVILLIQQGNLDQSLKEDILIVLRALRRRATVTQQAEAGYEANLEAVTAMLHFCRVVLRLSDPAIEDI